MPHRNKPQNAKNNISPKKKPRRPGYLPYQPFLFPYFNLHWSYNIHSILEFLRTGTLNFEKGWIQVEATSPIQDHTPKARSETTIAW